MIKREQVPEGLAYIARIAWADSSKWGTDGDWNVVIAAVLNAWPEARLIRNALSNSPKYIKLPVEGMAKENPDA